MAIYEGTDPGDASSWNKVGVYDINPPMGKNASLKAPPPPPPPPGGDFVIATEDGMVPITQAIQKDAAALSLSAISRAIEPEWQREVQTRRSKPWDILK